jgi:hypothetical protein
MEKNHSLETLGTNLKISNIDNKSNWTSLEILAIINYYRACCNIKTTIHSTVLKNIRTEFKEQFNNGEIEVSSYRSNSAKQQPMYIISNSQFKQLISREKMAVRQQITKFIEYVEEQQRIFEATEKENNKSFPFDTCINQEIKNINLDSSLQDKKEHLSKIVKFIELYEESGLFDNQEKKTASENTPFIDVRDILEGQNYEANKNQ